MAELPQALERSRKTDARGRRSRCKPRILLLRESDKSSPPLSGYQVPVVFFAVLPAIPSEVHQMRIEKSDGTRGIRLWVDDLPGLLGLVEMDVVELHPWGSTVDDPEHPAPRGSHGQWLSVLRAGRG